MKKLIFIIAIFSTIITTFSSCAVVEGIFKAGMGVGIFIVVLIIGLIIFLVSRIGKSKD
ncbi:MAG: phosphatidate cytidylyltransferase [Saprospiraceae bacterium]